MLVQLSDENLWSRLRNSEDHFVERKTVADQKDWVKTLVAFANSAPIDLPAVLFIGARDSGALEEREIDFDSIQKTLNQKARSIFPRVPYVAKVLKDGDKQVLAVVVLGSPLKPHFTGPSYVRVGSESVEASDEQFQALIAMRSSKVYRISQHIGKQISFVRCQVLVNNQISRGNAMSATVRDCNEFWVTIEPTNANPVSFVLDDVGLNFNHQMKNLQIEVTTRDY